MNGKEMHTSSKKMQNPETKAHKKTKPGDKHKTYNQEISHLL